MRNSVNSVEKQTAVANRYEWLMYSMEQSRKAAAIVSKDLMVLYHTQECESVLADGSFYTIQDWLPPEACAAVRCCISSGETQTVSADLGHMRSMIQMILLEQEALLIFEGEQECFPALLLDALRMREKAQRLLYSAQALDNIAGTEDVAADIRKTAMQLFRHAQHAELLGNEGGSSLYQSVELGRLLREIAAVLCSQGYQVSVQMDEEQLVIVDPALLKGALLTIAANSIQAGGKDVQIVFQARREMDSTTIRVEDNGPGMPSAAVRRMRNGWRQSDVKLLDNDWGFGLPFANRVAEMHGGRMYHISNSKNRGCVICLSLPDREGQLAERPEFYVNSTLKPEETELSIL